MKAQNYEIKAIIRRKLVPIAVPLGPVVSPTDTRRLSAASVLQAYG
jgi:hypothetical protein